MLNYDTSIQAWWCMPIIPQLRMLKQEDKVQRQPQQFSKVLSQNKIKRATGWLSGGVPLGSISSTHPCTYIYSMECFTALKSIKEDKDGSSMVLYRNRTYK